jgi:hypothetical protein
MTKDELVFLIERYGYARREGEHQGKKSYEWMHDLGDAIDSLVATATGPEATLQRLEALAREYERTIDIGYLLRIYEHEGEFHYINRGPQRTITRAEALALLEKGAK